MRSILVAFGALLLVISLPVIFLANRDARTQAVTESFAGTTTAAGVYTANVTLDQSTHDDIVNSVTGVSSNISSDSPTAATYNSVSKVLNVSGLAASETRTLSVTYVVDSTIIPTGAGTFFTISNWFFIFAIVGLLVGAIYAFFD